MTMDVLNESNFLIYAAKNYNDAQYYSTEEFYEDLNTITYIKRLFSRYEERDELRERLILNHLIKLYNVFDPKAITKILFYRIDEKHWPLLKTFLLFLNYMPEVIMGVGSEGHNIISKDISIDLKVVNALRSL